MFSLNQTQRDQFTNILKNMPKVALSFSEIGDGGSTTTADATSIAAKVRGLVIEKVKASEGKLTYASALLELYTEQPELKTEYEAALEETK
jgi:hypothetical protein